MSNHVWQRMLRTGAALLAAGSLAAAAWAGEGWRLQVAVAEPDLEAIVRSVGGGEVETFSLFKGCILRKDLAVEPAVKSRLAKADLIVWSGFLREAEAIQAALGNGKQPPGEDPTGKQPWLDVSPGAFRTNVPFTTCEGYPDPLYAAGDPFFWLNPENGSAIARNVAKGLSRLAPDREVLFHARAAAFAKALGSDIERWKQALRPLHGLRIFSAQCGWQNFSSMGGPKFLVCKATPGQLPTPQLLLDYVLQMKASIVLVDPHTPPDYAETFRSQPGLKVVEVPSSIEGLPGKKTYGDLFEHLVEVLLKAAKA